MGSRWEWWWEAGFPQGGLGGRAASGEVADFSADSLFWALAMGIQSWHGGLEEGVEMRSLWAQEAGGWVDDPRRLRVVPAEAGWAQSKDRYRGYRLEGLAGGPRDS